MSSAHKRQQVMLADAAKVNVANDDNLVVLLGKEFFQMLPRIFMQPAEQLLIHASYPGGRFLQPLPIGILADRRQNLADSAFDARQIERECGTVVGRCIHQNRSSVSVARQSSGGGKGAAGDGGQASKAETSSARGRLTSKTELLRVREKFAVEGSRLQEVSTTVRQTACGSARPTLLCWISTRAGHD